MSDIIETTGSNFQSEVMESDIPVLVDFWAPWCGPCKMLAPTLEELSKENGGKIKIVKINVDEEQEVATQFGITSIPTMMIFVDGKLKNQIVGSLPKHQIEEFIFECVGT